MTLAVICRSVLLRVGVHVDIVDCPGRQRHGHLLMGFPDWEVFLDLSEGGQVLNLEDCQRIASSYGIEWSMPTEEREDGEPWHPGEGHLDADEIIHDVLVSFIVACHRKRSTELETIESMLLLGKFQSLNRMRSNGNAVIARWCMIKHFLDPKVFRDFGLIDDDTMNKYLDAPYKLYR